jgi:hypothetical protein
MTRRPAGARRGITLTEILISILIMGIGLISLATLFPLGMVRLRAANQQHRSGLLAESATADLSTRGLLLAPYFLASGYYSTASNGFYNPLISDPSNPANPSAGGLSAGVNSTGVPFCYDPLWWYETGNTPNAALGTVGEVRFGQAVFVYPSANAFIRSTTADASNPAGHGLQRITNYGQTAGWPLFNPELTFASPDDQVMQNSDASPQLLSASAGTGQSTLSGVVPQWFPAVGAAVPAGFRNDLRYTWLFTGYQVDSTNLTNFVGSVVVMDSRPFSLDSVASPTNPAVSSPTAAGEIVMEGVFGYSGHVVNGFGVAADRIVLLRWPAAMPDPEIKVGSWICDVSYQRNTGLANSGIQRCNWYQVAKKGEVQADTDVAGYRHIVVTTTTPMVDRTALLAGGVPQFVNVALFMPSVINVFQRAITIPN